MSSSIERIPAADAWRLAVPVVEQLRDLCDRIEPAGSLRRGRATVGDVEIVALPTFAPALLARLDTWVAVGKIHQAHYPHNTLRWGGKYRGFVLRGKPSVRFELFLADADNWGYQFWLRTGPGDANHYVMSRLASAPYKPRDGYWWIGDTRLRVADEDALFRLLGLPFIPPEQRRIEVYQRGMVGDWAAVDSLEYAESGPTSTAASEQGVLF